MNSSRGAAFLVVCLGFGCITELAGAARDDLALTVDRAVSPGDLALTWSGGEAPYLVYRSQDPAAVVTATTRVATSAGTSLDVPEGPAQADYFLDNVDYVADGKTLPPMLDVEWPARNSSSPYPCYGLSEKQMVSWISSFVDQVRERTGQQTMIYTNAHWWNDCTGRSTAFSKQPLFVARYKSSPEPLPAGWDTWTMWQFTESGQVPGIKTSADRDAFNGTAEQLAALAS